MSKKSFTLIETLVVIFIISLLATIIVAGTSYARQKSRDGQRIADLTTVAGALNRYYLDNGGYPSGDFTSLVSSLMSPVAYLEKSISGPAYNYSYTSPNYWLWFTPEVEQNANCLDCSGHGNIFLIKNGKVSDKW